MTYCNTISYASIIFNVQFVSQSRYCSVSVMFMDKLYFQKIYTSI